MKIHTTKMKHRTVKILAIAAGVIMTAVASQAADLYLEGSPASGIYLSDAGIVMRNQFTVNTGTHIVAAAAFQTVLSPGSRVKLGGRLTIRNRDRDGLSNRCEMLFFGHLNYGPQDDPDVDWLDNYEECSLSTNPRLYDLDNDNDGLPDWWEIDYFGLTLSHTPNDDADGDGVSNYTEFKLRANPTINDLPGPGVHYEYDALGRIKRIYRIPTE